MISVREEGWKELKVGCFFNVESAPPLDPHTLDKDDLAHATKHLSSATHLAFGEGFAEAQRWFEQQELPFFGAIMGGRFDERWRTAYNSPQN